MFLVPPNYRGFEVPRLKFESSANCIFMHSGLHSIKNKLIQSVLEENNDHLPVAIIAREV